MAKALEPAVTPGDIVFELERFERSKGRLKLTGRWFGVRGRRFVRPTLTVEVQDGRVRALADLDDKPWAAEDGEPWTASFPWSDEGRLQGSELSVAPDIAIPLPAPGARRGRAQRLAAVPRREAMTASWGDLATRVDAESAPDEPGPEPDRSPETEILQALPEVHAPEPEVTSEELERSRAELAEAGNSLAAASAERDAVRDELASLRRELDEARHELERRYGQSDAAQSELTAARSGREAVLRSAAKAEAARETALTRATHLEAERDALAAEKTELATTLEQTQATLERLTREHDHAVASRGAALVMRGATQALPAYERHVGWLRRGLAVVVLVGVVFAALIVFHVL
jgi:predicted  nucleic acid-binding Zn-ribbon protein